MSEPAISPPFCYSTYVSVGDTNCFGTVYFTRYFEWQGRAREAFFRKVVPAFDALLAAGYGVFTVEAEMEYLMDLHVFEPVEISIELSRLRRASVRVSFVFHRGRQLVALGRQRLVFVSPQKQPAALPESVRQPLAQYILNQGGNHATPDSRG